MTTCDKESCWPQPLHLTLFLIGGAAIFMLACALDSAVHLQVVKWDITVAFSRWLHLFRAFGELPIWLLAALALWRHDYVRLHLNLKPLRHRLLISAQRGLVLLLTLAAAGLLAEIAKLLARRLRPSPEHAEYLFRAWTDRPLSTSGLGLPSSHTMIAFAAAFILMRLLPGPGVVWLIIGLGCALQRVLAQAHFLSDVTLAAILSFAVAQAVWKIFHRPTGKLVHVDSPTQAIPAMPHTPRISGPGVYPNEPVGPLTNQPASPINLAHHDVD